MSQPNPSNRPRSSGIPSGSVGIRPLAGSAGPFRTSAVRDPYAQPTTPPRRSRRPSFVEPEPSEEPQPIVASPLETGETLLQDLANLSQILAENPSAVEESGALLPLETSVQGGEVVEEYDPFAEPFLASPEPLEVVDPSVAASFFGITSPVSPQGWGTGNTPPAPQQPPQPLRKPASGRQGRASPASGSGRVSGRKRTSSPRAQPSSRSGGGRTEEEPIPRGLAAQASRIPATEVCRVRKQIECLSISTIIDIIESLYRGKNRGLSSGSRESAREGTVFTMDSQGYDMDDLVQLGKALMRHINSITNNAKERIANYFASEKAGKPMYTRAYLEKQRENRTDKTIPTTWQGMVDQRVSDFSLDLKRLTKSLDHLSRCMDPSTSKGPHGKQNLTRIERMEDPTQWNRYLRKYSQEPSPAYAYVKALLLYQLGIQNVKDTTEEKQRVVQDVITQHQKALEDTWRIVDETSTTTAIAPNELLPGAARVAAEEEEAAPSRAEVSTQGVYNKKLTDKNRVTIARTSMALRNRMSTLLAQLCLYRSGKLGTLDTRGLLTSPPEEFYVNQASAMVIYDVLKSKASWPELQPEIVELLQLNQSLPASVVQHHVDLAIALSLQNQPGGVTVMEDVLMWPDRLLSQLDYRRRKPVRTLEYSKERGQCTLAWCSILDAGVQQGLLRPVLVAKVSSGTSSGPGGSVLVRHNYLQKLVSSAVDAMRPTSSSPGITVNLSNSASDKDIALVKAVTVKRGDQISFKSAYHRMVFLREVMTSGSGSHGASESVDAWERRWGMYCRFASTFTTSHSPRHTSVVENLLGVKRGVARDRNPTESPSNRVYAFSSGRRWVNCGWPVITLDNSEENFETRLRLQRGGQGNDSLSRLATTVSTASGSSRGEALGGLLSSFSLVHRPTVGTGGTVGMGGTGGTVGVGVPGEEQKGSLVGARISVHPLLQMGGGTTGTVTASTGVGVGGPGLSRSRGRLPPPPPLIPSGSAGYALKMNMATRARWEASGASAFPKSQAPDQGEEEDWPKDVPYVEGGIAYPSPHLWFKTAGNLWEGKKTSGNSDNWKRKAPLKACQCVFGKILELDVLLENPSTDPARFGPTGSSSSGAGPSRLLAYGEWMILVFKLLASFLASYSEKQAREYMVVLRLNRVKLLGIQECEVVYALKKYLHFGVVVQSKGIEDGSVPADYPYDYVVQGVAQQHFMYRSSGGEDVEESLLAEDPSEIFLMRPMPVKDELWKLFYAYSSIFFGALCNGVVITDLWNFLWTDKDLNSSHLIPCNQLKAVGDVFRYQEGLSTATSVLSLYPSSSSSLGVASTTSTDDYPTYDPAASYITTERVESLPPTVQRSLFDMTALYLVVRTELGLLAGFGIGGCPTTPGSLGGPSSGMEEALPLTNIATGRMSLPPNSPSTHVPSPSLPSTGEIWERDIGLGSSISIAETELSPVTPTGTPLVAEEEVSLRQARSRSLTPEGVVTGSRSEREKIAFDFLSSPGSSTSKVASKTSTALGTLLQQYMLIPYLKPVFSAGVRDQVAMELLDAIQAWVQEDRQVPLQTWLVQETVPVLISILGSTVIDPTFSPTVEGTSVEGSTYLVMALQYPPIPRTLTLQADKDIQLAAITMRAQREKALASILESFRSSTTLAVVDTALKELEHIESKLTEAVIGSSADPSFNDPFNEWIKYRHFMAPSPFQQWDGQAVRNLAKDLFAKRSVFIKNVLHRPNPPTPPSHRGAWTLSKIGVHVYQLDEGEVRLQNFIRAHRQQLQTVTESRMRITDAQRSDIERDISAASYNTASTSGTPPGATEAAVVEEEETFA